MFVPNDDFDYLIYVLAVGIGLIGLCCGGLCFLFGPMALLYIRDGTVTH